MFITLTTIRDRLKTTFGDLFHSYMIDDPGLIPMSELPCVAVAPVSTEATIADNQRDQYTYTVDIVLIIDARQELLKYKQEMIGTQYLTEIMEAKDSTGALRTNTILYTVRHNLDLGDNWDIGNDASIDYSLRTRMEGGEQYVLKEARLRMAITRTKNR